MSTHLRSTEWAHHVVSPSRLNRAGHCVCGNAWLSPPPPPGLPALSWSTDRHAYAEFSYTPHPDERVRVTHRYGMTTLAIGGLRLMLTPDQVDDLYEQLEAE